MATEQRSLGLLDQYGLGITPEQLKKQDLHRRQQNALTLTGNLAFNNPTDAGMAQVGGLLAAALANRKFQPTDDEQRRISAVKEAQEKFDAWAKDNSDATDIQRTERYQEFLGGAAFRNGLPDIGASVLSSLDDQRAARKARDLELEKLGYETRQQKVETNITEKGEKFKIRDLYKEGMVTVYPVGSSNPNSALGEGYMDEDGSVIIGDKRLAPGTFTFTRPDRPPSSLLGGGGGTGLSKKDAMDLRKQRTDIEHTLDLMRTVDNVLTLDTADDSEAESLGWAGKLASGTVKLVNNARAIGRMVTGGEQAEDTVQFVDNKGVLQSVPMSQFGALTTRFAKDMEAMPVYKRLLEAGWKSDVIKRTMSELAYAIARANEQGGRTLSDQDYKAALMIAGEGMTDPQKLREHLTRRARMVVDDYSRLYTSIPEDVRTEVFDPTSTARYENNVKDFFNRFGQYETMTNPSAPAAPSPKGRGGARLISVTPGTQ